MVRFYQPPKKQSASKKHQSLTIERLDHHGAGIAYQQQVPIFVEGALPQEEVVVQVTEQKSNYSRARLIKVNKASPERVPPTCPHYHQCGGCDLQHLSYTAQQQHKQETLKQLMRKFSGAQTDLSLEPLISGAQWYYRRRTRLSAVNKQGQFHLGFRQRKNNTVIDIDHCPVLDRSLNEILAQLKAMVVSLKFASAVGHIELVLADNGPCILFRLVKTLPESTAQLLQDWCQQRGVQLFLDFGEGVRAPELADWPYYQETSAKIPFLPGQFIQVNQAVNQAMVSQAIDWLAPTAQDDILDLFCGLGNFSLPLATKARHVTAVEGVASMVETAQNNAQQQGIDNVDFYHANLEAPISEHPWAKGTFDKVLLDPARAGAAGIVEQFAHLGVKRVVYVSCNPATLARDSQQLFEQGYRLEKLGALDMFPHTSHLESMALFTR